jgi:hypothetical protein
MTFKEGKKVLEGQMGNIGTWRMLRIFPDFSGDYHLFHMKLEE